MHAYNMHHCCRNEEEEKNIKNKFYKQQNIRRKEIYACIEMSIVDWLIDDEVKWKKEENVQHNITWSRIKFAINEE